AFLRSGTEGTAEAISGVAERLGIASLLPQSFINLSNGQVRRARIARALLVKPELLILDDPFLGLDAAGRKDVADLVGGLIRQGVRVLLITRSDVIPEWVTHVLELDQAAIRWQGPRSEDGRWKAEDGRKMEPFTLPSSAFRLPPSGELVIELRNASVS